MTIGKELHGWLGLAKLAQDEKTMAELKWRERTIASKPQVACDHGLFSDEHLQMDLIESLHAARAAQDPV